MVALIVVAVLVVVARDDAECLAQLAPRHRRQLAGVKQMIAELAALQDSLTRNSRGPPDGGAGAFARSRALDADARLE